MGAAWQHLHGRGQSVDLCLQRRTRGHGAGWPGWSHRTARSCGPGGQFGCSFAAGTNPVSIAFDGAHMWVANFGSNNVSELNLNGTPVPGSPFGVGAHPAGIAFDGGTCG